MKPGIRKRQAAFEAYLGSLWNHEGTYDEDQLLGLVRDGLYLNKTTDLPSHSPGWLLMLEDDYGSTRIDSRPGFGRSRSTAPSSGKRRRSA